MKRMILITMLALAVAGCPADKGAGRAAPPAAPRASSSARALGPTGKPAMAAFTVELEGPGRVTHGEAFELSATIRCAQKVEGVEVKLQLPEGARLEAGAESVTVSVRPGAPAVVRYRLSVPDGGLYRFAVSARRAQQAVMALFEVGAPPAGKPAARRVFRTRDGRKVME